MRDAVALTASGPRFLTLGDEARLDVAVHNVEGPAGGLQARASMTAAPRPCSSASLDLKAGERRAEHVTIKPDDVGQITYDVRVTGPDGIDGRAPSDVRREAAGRRHQAHDGRVAQGRRRQHHAVAPTWLPT